jgi:hypothetical protein
MDRLYLTMEPAMRMLTAKRSAVGPARSYVLSRSGAGLNSPEKSISSDPRPSSNAPIHTKQAQIISLFPCATRVPDLD